MKNDRMRVGYWNNREETAKNYKEWVAFYRGYG